MKYDGIAGKVAIVTGAGGGIGEAYAKALAAQGARVAIAEIDKDKGERVAEAIRKDGARGALRRGRRRLARVDAARWPSARRRRSAASTSW